MVTIEVHAVTSRIVGELPLEIRQPLYSSLSYEDKNAFHKQRFSKYFVPEYKCLITDKRQEFRTGLLWRVCDTLENLDFAFQIKDLRIVADPDSLTTLSVDDSYFRDYQLSAIQSAIAERTGMVRIATGGGKTSVICGVAGKLERSTVILVHRLDLLRQVHETLLRLMLYPEMVGKVGGGIYEPSIITVCTVQTVCAALGIVVDKGDDDDKEELRGASAHRAEIERLLHGAQVVLLDEAHHAPARTISEVLRRCDTATWRVGFTATDWRDDGADLLLEAAFGPRIVDVSLSDLVEWGWLVPAQIWMYPQAVPEIYRLQGVENDPDNWQSLYKRYYVENPAFHDQVVSINAEWHEKGRHILTLVTAIKHGVKLQELHRNLGIPSIFLSGKDSQSHREAVLKDVIAGRLRCLIGTSIADEGLDLPILDALNLAGGGKSTTRVFQRVGRTLRTFPGKTEALVLDYRPINEKLKKHAGRRANTYRKEKTAFSFKEIKDAKTTA